MRRAATASRPTTSCCAAATAIRVFTPAKRLIGETDGKLMAGEVMAHIRKLGTVATKPEGRIVIR